MEILKKTSVLVMLIALLFSCNTEKKEAKNTDHKIVTDLVHANTNENGLKLLQQKCYACHSITSKSHDEIIAPPMIAVKRRYQMSFSNENDFVNGLTSWVMNPEEQNALMRGAISNFNIMPKQPFNEDEIRIIAAYMYQNELEAPSWFEQHFTEEHPNGMGNGNGNGNRNRNGNGNGMGRGNGYHRN
ncbi:c-type cytochrome [Lutibacter holmesii]|uniref:C-type cytochrome n=1 Tax=Lutibacter holmesii TaxID=1137985 RepID=A0ABW3WQT5_9FLAO